MKPPLIPTKVTALTSGIFLGIAVPLQELLTKSLGASVQVQNLVFVVALCVFFFGPVVLFVVGTEYFRFGWRDIVEKPYWTELWQVTIRALLWLLGVGLGFAILAALGV